MKKIALYAAALLVALVLSNCSDDLGLQQNEPNIQGSSSNSQVQVLDSPSQPKALRRIISFNFELPSGVVVGEVKTTQSTQQTSEINVVIPDGISLTSLTPTIVISADATGVSPASGVPHDFSNSISISPYQVKGPAPFLKRNYDVNVTYENDFLIYSAFPFPVTAGNSFSINGNFGLPASDYTATFINQTTGVTTVVGGLSILHISSLDIPTPVSLTPGSYKVTVSRRSVEKEIPGFITIQ